MSLLDMFAVLAFLLVDICAALSAFGAALILFFTLLGRFFKRRIAIPEQIFVWGLSCPILSACGTILLVIEGHYDLQKIGLLRFGVAQIIGLLLMATACLAVVALLPGSAPRPEAPNRRRG